jgi:hypothetical protein
MSADAAFDPDSPKFAIADPRQRTYVSTVQIAFWLGVMLIIGWFPHIPFAFFTVLLFLLSFADLAVRRRVSVQVSPRGLRFTRLGLMRLPVVIETDRVIRIAELEAPFLPRAIPFVTAWLHMPVPIGKCIAVETKQSPLSWYRWRAFRVQDRDGFREAVRRLLPQVPDDL